MDGFMTYERVKTPRGNSFRAVGDQLSDEIYVLDTETTGLEGAPKDLVVDIGICRVSFNDGTVEDVYSSVVGYDTSEWDDYLKNAWIFENTDMTLGMVEEAPPALNVIDEVRRILRRKPVTSYNTEYDFGKFLMLRHHEGGHGRLQDPQRVLRSLVQVSQAGLRVLEDRGRRSGGHTRPSGPPRPVRRQDGLLRDDRAPEGRPVPSVTSQ